MTGQDILNLMEVLNPELQLQSGEVNVVKGLIALNIAQDYFESLAAARKGIKGSGVGTVATTLNTESTAFPTGVLRIDRLSMIDPNTSRPKWDLAPMRRTGGHAFTHRWPWTYISYNGTGEPSAYWTNGTNIYWAPLPSGSHTVRWYGFQRASDITAGGTFAYDDIVALPLASFAVRLWKSGLDDAATDFASIAQETFKSTLDALDMFNRDGAVGFDYTHSHTE